MLFQFHATQAHWFWSRQRAKMSQNQKKSPQVKEEGKICTWPQVRERLQTDRQTEGLRCTGEEAKIHTVHGSEGAKIHSLQVEEAKVHTVQGRRRDKGPHIPRQAKGQRSTSPRISTSPQVHRQKEGARGKLFTGRRGTGPQIHKSKGQSKGKSSTGRRGREKGHIHTRKGAAQRVKIHKSTNLQVEGRRGKGPQSTGRRGKDPRVHGRGRAKIHDHTVAKAKVQGHGPGSKGQWSTGWKGQGKIDFR